MSLHEAKDFIKLLKPEFVQDKRYNPDMYTVEVQNLSQQDQVSLQEALTVITQAIINQP